MPEIKKILKAKLKTDDQISVMSACNFSDNFP